MLSTFAYTGGRASGMHCIHQIGHFIYRPDIFVSNKDDDQSCYSITKKNMKYLFQAGVSLK